MSLEGRVKIYKLLESEVQPKGLTVQLYKYCRCVVTSGGAVRHLAVGKKKKK